MKAVRLKIHEAAAELNVCSKTIHNHIRKYAAKVDTTKNNSLPSTPTNGLRGIPINISRIGRVTWRVDSRDLAEYIENATQATLGMKPYNWRANI